MPAVPKPAMGTFRRELREKRATAKAADPPPVRYQGVTAQRSAQKARRIVKAEKLIKDEVKRLDGYRCRWPGCGIDGTDRRDGALIEAAHFEAEGMGGDSTLERCTLENLITICHFHHRGPRGLHDRGLAKMRPLDDALGMRGPVEFSAAVPGEAGKFYVCGVTEPPKDMK